MRWPWEKLETRQGDIDYTDAVLTALLQRAQGGGGLVKSNIGAVAAAAGWWAARLCFGQPDTGAGCGRLWSCPERLHRTATYLAWGGRLCAGRRGRPDHDAGGNVGCPGASSAGHLGLPLHHQRADSFGSNRSTSGPRLAFDVPA